MDFPNTYGLKRPRYVYSADGKISHDDKLRGLLRYQPLKLADTSSPKCLFIFTHDDRDHANRLFLSLRNGISNFPGCKQLVGLSLESENVEPLRVTFKNMNDPARGFYDSINNYFGTTTGKPDFAFVIFSKRPDPRITDPYPAAKAALTKKGVPSQYVSWELLDSPNQFQYAISNIALSFFVKLGGIPWGVSIEKKVPALVVGVGGTQIEDPNSNTYRRLIGYAVCVLSNGVYLNTSFFPPAFDFEQFLASLKQGLREALTRMLDKNEAVEKVTVHVSRFERRKFIDTVRETIQENDRIQTRPLPYELVRLIQDSDFSVFDLAQPGYVSEEGTVVALGTDHALLVTEGRREKSVWRGRKPVTLEMRRDHVSSSRPRFRETIEEAFSLSTVNWRGFNTITQPMSLQYAKLLADLVGKMGKVDPEIINSLATNNSLNNVPWFI